MSAGQTRDARPERDADDAAAAVEGPVEPRQILNLTVAMDRDVIDGAPATRFVRRLVELIEGGHGLKGEPPGPAAEAEDVAA